MVLYPFFFVHKIAKKRPRRVDRSMTPIVRIPPASTLIFRSSRKTNKYEKMSFVLKTSSNVFRFATQGWSSLARNSPWKCLFWDVSIATNHWHFTIYGTLSALSAPGEPRYFDGSPARIRNSENGEFLGVIKSFSNFWKG